MVRRPAPRARAALTALVGALLVATSVMAAPAAAAKPDGQTAYGSGEQAATPGSRGKVNATKVANTPVKPHRPTTDLNLARPGRATDAATPGSREPAARELAVADPPTQPTETANPPIAQPGFAGLSRTSGPATNGEPPDPWVAVGPDHVAQVTNVSLRVTNRVGGSAIAIDLASFFLLPPGYNNTDPRVFYDGIRGRWIVTEVSWLCQAVDGHAYGYVDMLISDNADPTGNYSLWYWEFQDELPDYAALGSSADKLGWGVNLFTIPNGFPAGNCMSQPGADFAGADILVFDWADLLANGGPNGFLDTTELPDRSGEFSTPRVALQAPASSAALDVILEHTLDGGVTFNPYYMQINGSAVANTADFSALFDLVDQDVVTPWTAVHNPSQPGPDIVTTSIDTRPTDAIAQGSRLVFVANQECTPTGDASPRACVRVTELDTSGVNGVTPPSATQDMFVGDAGRDSYFGGVGLAGDGTLHVVWTASSTAAGDYPSSYGAYQLPSDGPNALSAPELLKAGTGTYSGSRWGDYVGVAQDPQVPNAAWQGNQYSAGGFNWATWVSQLQTGGSSYHPIEPVRVLDSRPAFNIGLTGVFSNSIPRSWQVAGFEVNGTPVIPDNAIAVTGNFVVVNQTAAGYAAITTTPNSNPATSSLNFPAGDTRANNVTVPLSSTGTLSAVYKASAGKTTYFIFDVTGYFLAGDEEATYSAITPARVLDSRTAFGIGLTGRFFPNVPRTLTVAGVGPIPVDATAVTANLTVVNQTRAGFLAVTPTQNANPTTSTMNFPAGDIRANGLTAPLSGGALSIVYKSSGGSTDVILDITGYYRDSPSGLLFFPLAPGRLFDSRGIYPLSQLNGLFTSSTPRTVSANDHFGIPSTAGAITGNLTIVGQTAAGYAAITPTPNANPPTSVINFPLGDIRANGVTVPLNGSYDLSFVYKAKSGSRTHMIMDVTGYFR